MSIKYPLSYQIIIILSIAGLLFSSFSFAQSPTAPEALQVWRGMLNWFRNFWDSYISSWFWNIWYKISSFLSKEVETRKPEVKEEFEKEKQEMREEIKKEAPKIGKSLWQRFKELIK